MKWQDAVKGIARDFGEPLLDAAATELYDRLQSVDVRKPNVAKDVVNGLLEGLISGAKQVPGNVSEES